MEKNNFYIKDNKKHKLIRVENGTEFNAYCTEHKEEYQEVHILSWKPVGLKYLYFWGVIALSIFLNYLFGLGITAFGPGYADKWGFSFFITFLVFVICLTELKNQRDYLKVK